MTLSEHDLQALRVAVREASRRAWKELRATHPSESFYYYGLWTTGVIHRPAPTACSAEGLARQTARYNASGMACSLDELRWSESDSPYDLFGDAHFSVVEELFAATGDPYERSPDVADALLGVLVGALSDLDREGFFGTGEDRARVVINVTIPGEEEESSTVDRARILNPPSALRQYELDLLPEDAG